MTQHIMVIDDVSGIRLLLRDCLKAAGYGVCLAANGQEGLQLFHAQPADLVITDIFMPERDGLEVIRELRQRHPTLPIIAISGEARVPTQTMLPVAKALGANQVMVKPFRMRDLIANVKALLPPLAA
jgi:DNA-binding response OmpR family regulator